MNPVWKKDGEQFKEPFKSMNPFNCIPFLELDDGTIISESISICRYLEEEHFPNPSLFGNNPQNKAYIDMWNRRLELDCLTPLGFALRNKVSMFADRVVILHRGKLFCDCAPNDVMTDDWLFDAYECDLRVNKRPKPPAACIIPHLANTRKRKLD